jgi:hypothetical protein
MNIPFEPWLPLSIVIVERINAMANLAQSECTRAIGCAGEARRIELVMTCAWFFVLNLRRDVPMRPRVFR